MKRSPSEGPWTCYALSSSDGKRSYTGQTNHFERRLRQHNGEISGGARYTKTKTRWTPLFCVTQFKTLRSVLQFEIAMKKRKVPSKFDPLKRHYTRGPQGRVRQLEFLLSLGKINDEFSYEGLAIQIHMKKDLYLKWSGLSETEFQERRQKQNIKFEFF